MLIYHIVTVDEWAKFSGDEYHHASLETEGFIHCSFHEQLDGVMERYYRNAETVIVLTIDSDKLTSPLKNELSTNNEIYPHIYGPINHDAIIDVNKRKVSF